MLEVLKKYSGVLFFYLAIAGMVLLVTVRFKDYNVTSDNTNIIACENN